MQDLNNNNDNILLLTVFALTAILFSMISGWQTYNGYRSLLGDINSIGFAIVTSLLMFFLNMALRKNRIHYKPTAGVIIILLTIITVSFLGNFNAIYSRFAQNELTEQTIDNARDNFDSNMKNALQALSSIPEVKEIQERNRQLKIERRNLYLQITDPNNAGFGDKARKHFKNIEALLGVELTHQEPPSEDAGKQALIDYAKKIDKRIWDSMKDNVDSNADRYNKIVVDIGILQDKYKEITNNESNQSAVVNEMRRDSQEVSNYLESLNIKLTLKNIDTHTDDLGEINKTLRSAFVEMPEPSVTLIVSFISLLIDLLIPLVTLAYYRPGDYVENKSNYNSGTGTELIKL